MFFGEASINLDAKGRMAIPTRFREPVKAACDDQLMLTYNAFENHSLWLYPLPEWEKVKQQVMGMSTFDPAHRQLQRRLIGSAAPVEPDGSGRILLPVALRQVSNLERRVVMMGLGNKFEIWNEDVLNRARHEHPLSDVEPSGEMRELVL